MKKLTYAMIVLLAFVCVPLCAQTAEKKPTVVIVPFEAKSKGIEQDDCDIVTESFESEYARTGSALVVNRNTFKKIQAEQAFQNSDWSNSDKTAKLGEALNAQQLIFGSLRIYNDILFVIVQVQDIKTLAVLASMHTQVKDIMELLETIPDICKNIAAQMQGESAPAVVPKNTPSTKPVQTAKNSTSKAYKIGDIGPGGGWVFYYSEEGFEVHDGKNGVKACHYLEVSKDEIGIIVWCSDSGNGNCRPMTEYGLGYGLLNTFNIVISKHRKPLTASDCAAYACAQYKTDSTNAGEWFLPSRDELNLLYKNFGRQILQGTSTGYSGLWSSSLLNGEKKNNGYPSVQWFTNGRQDWYGKASNHSVRAVRAF